MVQSNTPSSSTEPPLHAPSSASLALSWAVAALAGIAVIWQLIVSIAHSEARGLTVLDAIDRSSTYLTNLTVFLTAICFLFVATRSQAGVGRFFRAPPVVSAVVVYIAFVGVAYNLLLRGLWVPTGLRAVLNELLHSVVPVLAVLYWVLFVPRFHLSVRQCVLWLLYPLLYLFVTLWRGSKSDFYPYPFIDVDELGYRHVLFNSAMLVLAFLALMGVFLYFNHRRRR